VPPPAEVQIDPPPEPGSPTLCGPTRRADEEGPPAPAGGADPFDLGQEVMTNTLAAKRRIDDDALDPELVVDHRGGNPHDDALAPGGHDDGVGRWERWSTANVELSRPFGDDPAWASTAAR